MARLALAAHDPGGASVLVAAAPALRAAGHDLTWLPAGPAAKLWREAGEAVPEAMDATAATAALERDRPALLLTGTSFYDDFERVLWVAARRFGIPSFAVLDAWTNIEQRFVSSDGAVEQPDSFGVMDEATRAQVAAAGRYSARLFVIGQPHLAARTKRLTQRRQSRRPGPEKTIVFFSEPIAEDYGKAARGFTQIEVATLVAQAFADAPTGRLIVKPHPRESESGWRDWLAQHPRARLSDQDTEALLLAADGVVGMTTMVLLEAALAGIPVVSLQPDRIISINPILDSMVPVIARRADVAKSLSVWISGLASPPSPPSSMRDIVGGGGVRFTAAVDEILAGTGPKA